MLTEEARMCSHVGALQHLCEPAKGSDNAFEHLEGGGGAVVEAVGKTVGVVHAHTAHTAHAAAVHATIATHTSIAAHAAHTTHAAVHTATHAAKARVWTRVG